MGVGHITAVPRQNGGIIPNRHSSLGPPPPPPPVTRHANNNSVNSQSPLRQNGGPPIVGRMNVATPPVSRNHEQYSRNWPPNSQNQMDMHHVKKMLVPGGSAKRPGHPYEPSGEEMSFFRVISIPDSKCICSEVTRNRARLCLGVTD